MLAVGDDTFIGDVITLAGGRMATAGIGRGYFSVSDEWVLRQNPDAIICVTEAPPGAALVRLRQTLGWRSLDAVIKGRVYDDIDRDTLCRPGPRVLEAADQVRAALRTIN